MSRAICLLLGLALTPGQALADAACSVGRVDLRWPGGSESFAVEVADEAPERSRGLMFRENPRSRGGNAFCL